MAIRDEIRSLVRHSLSDSILFEHDPEEVYFWLFSLPMGVRPLDAETPDGTPLLNEQTAVVNFLDDCIHLCLKAPYGYIEGLGVLCSDSTTTGDYQHGRNGLSPLLATVMEQISSRSASSLCPSDMLAIISFTRRLLVRLAGKRESLGHIVRLSEKLASLPVGETLIKDHAIVANSVTQEITILKHTLLLLDDPTAPISMPANPPSAVADFLDRIENMPLRTTLCSLRICFANQCLQRRQGSSVGARPSNSLTAYASLVAQSRKRWRFGWLASCHAFTGRQWAYFWHIWTQANGYCGTFHSSPRCG
jgi:nucleolar pre-ribosomal-associated protein 1